MEKLRHLDMFLFSAKNKYEAHSAVINVSFIIIYLTLITYYIPFISSNDWVMKNDFIWYKIYKIINPFTTGSYIFGLVVLVQYIMGSHIIIRLLASMFYGMVIFFSLVLIMGITKLWELYVFLPHILIIFMCIAILFRKRSITKIKHSV